MINSSDTGIEKKVYESRAGVPVRQKEGYLVFIPKPLPPQPPLRMDSTIINELSNAEKALARLDGAALTLPDIEIFTKLFIRKEALLSTQIEGTQSTLRGVLACEAGIATDEDPDELREVINYINTLDKGLKTIGEKPDLNYILELHKTLIKGTRGDNKNPGKLRNVQNYIGRPGSTIHHAIFIPPPPEMIPSLINDLLNFFISGKDNIHPLIKAAYIHAQFETIHPFMDGNGRLGRLLIVIGLWHFGIISHPLITPSLYLKEHQDAYYELLNNVRYEGDWENWCLFFLKGLTEVSKKALNMINRIHILQRETIKKLRENGLDTPASLELTELLFKKPVISVKDIISELAINRQSAYDLVNKFEEAGILKEITGKKRYRKYLFSGYLAVIES